MACHTGAGAAVNVRIGCHMSRRARRRLVQHFVQWRAFSTFRIHRGWRNGCRLRHTVRRPEALATPLTSLPVALVYQLYFAVRVDTPEASLARFVLQSGHLNEVAAFGRVREKEKKNPFQLARKVSEANEITDSSLDCAGSSFANPCLLRSGSTDSSLK